MVKAEFNRAASNRLLLACVLVTLVSSFLVSRIQESWGEVQVREVRIPTHNGQWVAGDLF